MTDSPIPSRRDFLAGRAVSQAAQAAARAAADKALAENSAGMERRPHSYVMHVGRSVMACEFEIMLNAGEHPEGPDAALRALDLADSLEAQLTVYRETSEVSRLNSQAARGPVLIEKGLFDLLSLATRIGIETNAAFDITSGPLSKAWGFYRRAGRLPSEEELAAARERVGHQHLVLDAERQTVAFRRAGVEINLGAIGKGYALDRCADSLTREGIDNFLIHGGTSSILGRGSRAGLMEGESSWLVAVRHPLRPEQRLAEVRLRDRALGTSGSASQFFFHQGRRLGHVLDPRTGWPAEQVLSATVLAPTAALADALSTAFYVMGPDGAAAYCAAHPEIGALLILPDSRAGATRITLVNVSDADCDLLDEAARVTRTGLAG
ncbi:MAG: FAD:protein FMN transferase [Planctomycetota bacterium]